MSSALQHLQNRWPITCGPAGREGNIQSSPRSRPFRQESRPPKWRQLAADTRPRGEARNPIAPLAHQSRTVTCAFRLDAVERRAKSGKNGTFWRLGTGQRTGPGLRVQKVGVLAYVERKAVRDTAPLATLGTDGWRRLLRRNPWLWTKSRLVNVTTAPPPTRWQQIGPRRDTQREGLPRPHFR
jgi:hypothetical protein